MPNVSFTRPEYDALSPRWGLIRDCLAGETQVKARGTQYLPMPNPLDDSAENRERYNQYVARAVFFNATAYTAKGMAGEVTSVPPEVELPAEIETMEQDVDGAGNSLRQQANGMFTQVLAFGRGGILTDYPSVDAGGVTTAAQLRAGKVRPTLTTYQPWDIINWRTVSVGGTVKLSRVVLSEQYVTDDDGFEQELDDQWRVLYLDEQGLYVVEEWVKVEGKDEYIIKPLGGAEEGSTEMLEARYEPRDANGNRLDYIPFTFVGAETNDPAPDLPPLYDLASLNIAHYRNSADHEESCFITGQPTAYFGGLTKDWVTDVMKGMVQMGARAAVLLPANSSAGLLQASPNSMPFAAMQHKEAQMVALGARLVQQQAVQRTALEASQEGAARGCTLANIANNVSEAYRRALAWARAFVAPNPPTQDGIKFALNTDFRSATMTSQERAQLVAEWMSGALTDEEMRENMTRCGIASEDFDTWLTKREEQALTKPVAGIPAAPGAAGQEKSQTPAAKQQNGTPAA